MWIDVAQHFCALAAVIPSKANHNHNHHMEDVAEFNAYGPFSFAMGFFYLIILFSLWCVRERVSGEH